MSEESKTKDKAFEFPMMPIFGVDLGERLGSLATGQKQLENDLKEIKQDHKEVAAKLSEKIDAVDAKLTAKIDAVDAKLTAKIDAVDGRVDKCLVAINRMDERMTGMEKRMDERMTGMEKRMDERMTGMEKRLDSRLDSTRNLMFAIMAAVIAGIILQFFAK